MSRCASVPRAQRVLAALSRVPYRRLRADRRLESRFRRRLIALCRRDNRLVGAFELEADKNRPGAREVVEILFQNLHASQGFQLAFLSPHRADMLLLGGGHAGQKPAGVQRGGGKQIVAIGKRRPPRSPAIPS